MFTPISVEKQYERTATDNLRVLVVGAGIAGVTIAQLLRRGGRHPVLIERGDSRLAPGYMLALMPMVDAVLDEVGVRDAYRAASVPLERYAVHGAHRPHAAGGLDDQHLGPLWRLSGDRAW